MSPAGWLFLILWMTLIDCTEMTLTSSPSVSEFSYVPRLHPSRNPGCRSRYTSDRRSAEDHGFDRPSIEVRAVLAPCSIFAVDKSFLKDDKLYDREQRSPDDDRWTIKNCTQKIVINMKLNNIGTTDTRDKYVVIDHAVDPASMKKFPLRNPYVIKVRQEAVLQLYGLKFQSVSARFLSDRSSLSAEAREDVINNETPNYRGCSVDQDNPTCGQTLLRGEPVPFSQGFCCSCDPLAKAAPVENSTASAEDANRPRNRLPSPSSHARTDKDPMAPRQGIGASVQSRGKSNTSDGNHRGEPAASMPSISADRSPRRAGVRGFKGAGNAAHSEAGMEPATCESSNRGAECARSQEAGSSTLATGLNAAKLFDDRGTALKIETGQDLEQGSYKIELNIEKCRDRGGSGCEKELSVGEEDQGGRPSVYEAELNAGENYKELDGGKNYEKFDDGKNYAELNIGKNYRELNIGNSYKELNVGNSYKESNVEKVESPSPNYHKESSSVEAGLDEAQNRQNAALNDQTNQDRAPGVINTEPRIEPGQNQGPNDYKTLSNIGKAQNLAMTDSKASSNIEASLDQAQNRQKATFNLGTALDQAQSSSKTAPSIELAKNPALNNYKTVLNIHTAKKEAPDDDKRASNINTPKIEASNIYKSASSIKLTQDPSVVGYRTSSAIKKTEKLGRDTQRTPIETPKRHSNSPVSKADSEITVEESFERSMQENMIPGDEIKGTILDSEYRRVSSEGARWKSNPFAKKKSAKRTNQSAIGYETPFRSKYEGKKGVGRRKTLEEGLTTSRKSRKDRGIGRRRRLGVGGSRRRKRNKGEDGAIDSAANRAAMHLNEPLKNLSTGVLNRSPSTVESSTVESSTVGSSSSSFCYRAGNLNSVMEGGSDARRPDIMAGSFNEKQEADGYFQSDGNEGDRSTEGAGRMTPEPGTDDRAGELAAEEPIENYTPQKRTLKDASSYEERRSRDDFEHGVASRGGGYFRRGRRGGGWNNGPTRRRGAAEIAERKREALAQTIQVYINDARAFATASTAGSPLPSPAFEETPSPRREKEEENSEKDVLVPGNEGTRQDSVDKQIEEKFSRISDALKEDEPVPVPSTSSTGPRRAAGDVTSERSSSDSGNKFNEPSDVSRRRNNEAGEDAADGKFADRSIVYDGANKNVDLNLEAGRAEVQSPRALPGRGEGSGVTKSTTTVTSRTTMTTSSATSKTASTATMTKATTSKTSAMTTSPTNQEALSSIEVIQLPLATSDDWDSTNAVFVVDIFEIATGPSSTSKTPLLPDKNPSQRTNDQAAIQSQGFRPVPRTFDLTEGTTVLLTESTTATGHTSPNSTSEPTGTTSITDPAFRPSIKPFQDVARQTSIELHNEISLDVTFPEENERATPAGRDQRGSPGLASGSSIPSGLVLTPSGLRATIAVKSARRSGKSRLGFPGRKKRRMIKTKDLSVCRERGGGRVNPGYYRGGGDAESAMKLSVEARGLSLVKKKAGVAGSLVREQRNYVRLRVDGGGEGLSGRRGPRRENEHLVRNRNVESEHLVRNEDIAGDDSEHPWMSTTDALEYTVRPAGSFVKNKHRARKSPPSRREGDVTGRILPPCDKDRVEGGGCEARMRQRRLMSLQDSRTDDEEARSSRDEDAHSSRDEDAIILQKTNDRSTTNRRLLSVHHSKVGKHARKDVAKTLDSNHCVKDREAGYHREDSGRRDVLKASRKHREKSKKRAVASKQKKETAKRSSKQQTQSADDSYDYLSSEDKEYDGGLPLVEEPLDNPDELQVDYQTESPEEDRDPSKDLETVQEDSYNLIDVPIPVHLDKLSEKLKIQARADRSKTEDEAQPQPGKDFEISLTGKIHLENDEYGRPVSVSFDAAGSPSADTIPVGLAEQEGDRSPEPGNSFVDSTDRLLAADNANFLPGGINPAPFDGDRSSRRDYLRLIRAKSRVTGNRNRQRLLRLQKKSAEPFVDGNCAGESAEVGGSGEDKNSGDRDREDKNREGKISEDKDSEAKNSEVRNSEAKDSEAMISEAMDSEALISETKDSEAMISETKDSEAMINEARESEAKASEAMISKTKDSEAKISEAEDTEVKNTEAKDTEDKASEAQNCEAQNNEAEISKATLDEDPSHVEDVKTLVKSPEAASLAQDASLVPEEVNARESEQSSDVDDRGRERPSEVISKKALDKLLGDVPKVALDLASVTGRAQNIAEGETDIGQGLRPITIRINGSQCEDGSCTTLKLDLIEATTLDYNTESQTTVVEQEVRPHRTESPTQANNSAKSSERGPASKSETAGTSSNAPRPNERATTLKEDHTVPPKTAAFFQSRNDSTKDDDESVEKKNMMAMSEFVKKLEKLVADAGNSTNVTGRTLIHLKKFIIVPDNRSLWTVKEFSEPRHKAEVPLTAAKGGVGALEEDEVSGESDKTDLIKEIIGSVIRSDDMKRDVFAGNADCRKSDDTRRGSEDIYNRNLATSLKNSDFINGKVIDVQPNLQGSKEVSERFEDVSRREKPNAKRKRDVSRGDDKSAADKGAARGRKHARHAKKRRGKARRKKKKGGRVKKAWNGERSKWPFKRNLLMLAEESDASLDHESVRSLPRQPQIRGGQDCQDQRHPEDVDLFEYLQSAHCLRFSELWYSVYQLEQPVIDHKLHMQIYEKRTKADGSIYWKDLANGSSIRLGTLDRHYRNREDTMALVYNDPSARKIRFDLDHENDRLLVPSAISGNGAKQPNNEGWPGEYLVLQAAEINENADECDKAGVGFAGFVGQPDRCERVRGTCLKNQPLAYWRHDSEARESGRAGCYFLSNFAPVPGEAIKYNVNGTGSREFLALEYHSPHVSVIDVELRADYNALLSAGSFGRLTELYSDSTSVDYTVITALVTNNGSYSSSYRIRITDCPRGVPWSAVESSTKIVSPHRDRKMSLDLYGRLSLSEFSCSVALLNRDGEPVASRQIKLRKMDRCFCLRHCECYCEGQANGNRCEPMTLENYRAAGFRGLPPSMEYDSVARRAAAIVICLTLITLLLLLIFMGFLKWLIGLCYPGINRWGLDTIIEASKLKIYFEKDLQSRSVVFDQHGAPVHPDTKQKTVRVCNRKLEFLLNLVFFFVYPFAPRRPGNKRKSEDSRRTESNSNLELQPTLVSSDDDAVATVCVSTYGDSVNSRLEAEDTRYVIDELKKSQESLRNHGRYKHESDSQGGSSD